MLTLHAAAGNAAVTELIQDQLLIQRAPPHLASSEIKYETGSHRIPPPEERETVASIRTALDEKRKTRPAGLGPKELELKGVSGEEVFVLHAVWSLAEHRNWSTEFHVVIDIGRGRGGKAPRGEVSIRFDQAGNVVAELVHRGPIPPIAGGFPDSRSALRSDFGIADIRDRSARWTNDELDKVHAAFSRLPAADRSALADVVLIRQHIALLHGKPKGGRFSSGKRLASGATTPSGEDTLTLADSAFVEGSGFEGDSGGVVLPSFEVILHEAGHAVEKKAVRDTELKVLIAQGGQNQALRDLAAADSAMVGAINPALQKFALYAAADHAAATPYVNSIKAVIGVLHGYGNATKRKSPAFEPAVEKAIAARDKAKASLEAANPALADFADASSKEDDFFKAGQALAKTDADIATAEKAKEAISAAWGKSRRLQNFVDFVTANGIVPLTDYARTNWPAHPEEFWAEAYSLWINDHAYLVTSAKPLADWFDAGEHRKDTKPAPATVPSTAPPRH